MIAVSDLSRKWQQFWIILLLSLLCLSEVISDKAMGDANLPLGAALAVVMLIVTALILGLAGLATRGRRV